MSEVTRIEDGYYDRLSVMKAVQASTDLATFLGESLTNSDYGVMIKSDGSLHCSFDGTAADANNAQLPTVYSIHGKKYLEDVRIYSASSQDVSIILYTKTG